MKIGREVVIFVAFMTRRKWWSCWWLWDAITVIGVDCIAVFVH